MDLGKQASQGTTQYVRGTKSSFDAENNPKEVSSATAILGVEAKTQNPWLTNIVLARKVRADGTVSIMQYLGNDGSDAANIEHANSLQQQNKHNVADIGALTVINESKSTVATALEAQKKQVEFAIKAYEKKGNDLTVEQKEDLAVFQKLKAELEALGEGKAAVGYVGLNPTEHKMFTDAGAPADNLIIFGDDAPTSTTVLGDASGSTGSTANATPVTYDAKGGVTGTFTGAGALGLVGMNFKNGDTKQAIQGTEEKSQSSTRVFGRQYNEKTRAETKANSYFDANVFALGEGDVANELTGLTGTDPEADLATIKDNKLVSKAKINYHLAVKPQKLDYVQYGRVTGNLDPIKVSSLTDDEKAKLEKGETITKRAAFAAKDPKGEKADNFYFYRGIDATTIEQMAALPTDKILNYQGHALMYGIDNSFHGGDKSQFPTAWGTAGGTHAIGNFVSAEVDLSKGKVGGHVYNVWADGSKDRVIDSLVKFKGQVFGNTVLGTAERTYKAGDADFRASFFGEQASEMGGSFNSVTTAEKYSSDDVWGGVFGAKRTVEPVKSDDGNGFLGDLPDTTKPVIKPKP
ncbi:transferrin-binding protein-like solute binding protein [Dichelobacter nodosus]|uniref:transferrin-binding protein-like solute binding protein n=1 Tax=Dichelobacter nodosus TaxID=870 RepID=UPI0039EA1939